MPPTHFGYKVVDESEKSNRVKEVFDTVATRYDLMNDLMSLGLHRWWKTYLLQQIAPLPNMRILDIAGGTGDIALAIANHLGQGQNIHLTDINYSMLEIGRDKLINAGFFCPVIQCDAQALPFESNLFDCVVMAFGLRNMTDAEQALREALRVLRPAGRLFVLEFSRVTTPLLSKAYDLFSFSVLPWLGKHVAKSEASYRYLAESIRMHPDQETLKTKFSAAGFGEVCYNNLLGGIIALHQGTKLLPCTSP